MTAPAREGPAPLFEVVAPLSYTDLQRLLDDSAPWGVRAYEKAVDLDELSDEAIAVIAGAARGKTSPMSFLPIFALRGGGGASSLLGRADTAFGGSRRPHFVCNVNALAHSADDLAADRAWVRQLWADLSPFASNTGSYVNFQAEPEGDRVRVSYGDATYERLSRVKAMYDPRNLFCRNANVMPARPRA